MPASITLLTVALAASGVQAPPGAAADSARARALVAEARTHLAANRLDTAVTLLQAALASPGAASGAARAEIFLLFAIALHFQGNAPGMGRAVAEALAAEREFQALNLAAVAPEVAESLEARRAAGRRGDPLEDLVAPQPEGPFRVVYPRHLVGGGIEGRVILSGVVDTSGRVDSASIRVVEAAHADFVEPARKALLEGRFHPARLDGRPVPMVVRVPFDFYVGERGAPTPPTDTVAGAVRDCMRRCKGGERKPVLLSFPNLWQLYGAPYPINANRTREFLLAQFIVDETGATRAGSIVIAAGTARLLEDAFRRGLMQARFRPAMAGHEPVAAVVELRIEVRREGTGMVTYSVSGP